MVIGDLRCKDFKKCSDCPLNDYKCIECDLDYTLLYIYRINLKHNNDNHIKNIIVLKLSEDIEYEKIGDLYGKEST